MIVMEPKRLGLIGYPLGHSWSPEIHRFMKAGDYRLWQLEKGELDSFFSRKEFDGINVTIPYKNTVLKYLDEMDDTVRRIQATNCIVNENGILKGYNTDVAGMLRIADHHGIAPGGGEAAILGSGGASKAAEEVCRLRNWPYHVVSRSSRNGCIGYDDLRNISDRITIIINATPVGMMPNEDDMPVDPSDFAHLEYLIDVVANPLRTTLAYEAQMCGVKAFGGLEMLVAQALAADELFLGKSMDDALIEECMTELVGSRRNIVLTGMPSAGKTTVGKMLAERLNRPFYDIDSEIVSRIGMPIAEYFAQNGEEAFRRLESEECRRHMDELGIVIATGGGVVKNRENMRCLAHNGLIVWLDRGLDNLMPTASRPLSASREALAKLYEERLPLYETYSDIRVDNTGSPEEAVNVICDHMKKQHQ